MPSAEGIQTPLPPSAFARLATAARYAISGVAPTTWFGPQQPLTPMAPPEVKGRQFDYASAVSWFANRHSQVSAHIVLKEDGSEATQMVPFAKKAWHACDYNSRAIGLEMAGFAKSGYGEAEWAVAAGIVASLLHKYQIPALWARHGEGPGFCSHYDLGAAGGGHSDPTTDGAVWAGFVKRVQDAFARGFLPVWGEHDAPPAPPAPVTARSIASAYPVDSVRWIQSKVGVIVDGVAGPATIAAITAFQRAHGLTADGIIGPKTLAALG